MKRRKFLNDRLPEPGNTYAIVQGEELHKPAGLLFDKINIFPGAAPVEEIMKIPEEITFGLKSVRDEVSKGWTNEDTKDYLKKIMEVEEKIGLKKENSWKRDLIDFPAFIMIKNAVKAYSNLGIKVIPIYSSTNEVRRFLFSVGRSIAYEAAMDKILLVSNEDVAWDQIMEFRKDEDAKKKYRSLRLWFEDGLKTESIGHATDVISKRIEDYEWAIKKHGLKTRTGALSKILSLKSIASIAAGAGLTSLVGGPVWSMIAAGSLISSKVILWIADRKIDREDIKHEFQDIAYLLDIQKKFEK